MGEFLRPVYSDELLHYQVKGAKWGVRRWQNLDGSLTPEGRIHYGIGPARDKDPDLVDPVKTARADVERLGTAYDRWKGASDNVKRYAKESNARRKLFEKRSDYDERIKAAKKSLDLAENEEINFGNEFDAAHKEAQARFEKYMQLSDELFSDINWIDQHMVLETDETGSKQTYLDSDVMLERWQELEDAVDTYWYNGLMNHDRASNANAEYRDKFEMNDSPRGKEAELNTTAKRALRTAQLPKNQDKFRSDIHNAIVNNKGLEGVKTLSSIDTAPLSSLYKIYFDKDRYSETLRDEYKAKADKVADKIAKQIVPDEHNRVNVDPSLSSLSTQDIVAEYIKEKAMFGAAGEDEQILETLWGGTTYSNSDTVRDARAKMKKKS